MSAQKLQTVLLTGFEPFDGAASNSSWEAVCRVAKAFTAETTHYRDGIRLVTARVPVTFDASLAELIKQHSPDIVIATGLANGRAVVTPERVAINLADARIPDNSGAQPRDEPVVAGGDAAYFSSLPVKAMVLRMRSAGIAADLSQSAGSFVCNALMYRLMRTVAGTKIRAGFIHVPCSPELAAGTPHPSLSVEVIAHALEIAILTSLEVTIDAGWVPGNDN